jgi:hypothetical protein
MPKKGVVLEPETEETVESLSAAKPQLDPALVTLSTGVVLRVRPVPQSLFADLVARYPAPDPPVTFDPDKGREEENPDDPTYLKRVQETNAQVAKAMSDAVILLGTTVERVPKGIPGQETTEWADELRLLGYELKGPRARYLAWVKFVAGPTLADYQTIWKAVGRLTGVTEQDTQAAVRRFPRGARRNGHH